MRAVAATATEGERAQRDRRHAPSERKAIERATGELIAVYPSESVPTHVEVFSAFLEKKRSLTPKDKNTSV